MKIFALLLVVFACGCTASPIGVSDDPTITADLAVEGAAAIVAARRVFQPSPPQPGPPARVKCGNCNGTGKIGDTTNIVYQCPVCRGAGFVDSAKPCVSGTCKPGAK